MAEKILMLALSPTMESGMIVKWRKQEGESVHNGDVLCEVETDKATMEYQTINEGILLKILVPEGQQAAVGDAIAIIGQVGEDISGLSGVAGRQAAEPASTEPRPSIATGEAAAPTHRKEGAGATGIRSSPMARRLASEHGLNIKDIAGTGPQGRVVEQDVERVIRARGLGGGTVRSPAAALAPGDEVLAVTPKRRMIAQRMAESKFTAPHYYLKVTVLAEALMRDRELLNSKRPEKVSLNAFLVKYVAEALKRHRLLNAAWNGDTIIQHGRADIAVAVAQEEGLIAPVVRDCGNKGISLIDKELRELVAKARMGRLVPGDYSNSTFTISNLGSAGIEEFTAIINPPNSAILAVGRVAKRAVVDEDGQVCGRTTVKLTLSCDHRVIDGAEGAAFLLELKSMMEAPIREFH